MNTTQTSNDFDGSEEIGLSTYDLTLIASSMYAGLHYISEEELSDDSISI